MIYVYRPVRSTGAKLLAEALGGTRVMRLPKKDDTNKVVCWGAFAPELGYCKTLNNKPILSKFNELEKIREGGVETIWATRVAPGPNWDQWLPRSSAHHEGNDLLAPGTFAPSYWVRREEIKEEFRIHVWKEGEDYVSIRVGVKRPRAGVEQHPWIRSWQAGWYLNYGEGPKLVKQKHRDAAKGAVQALGLDFGAVDLGVRPDGSLVVFEVNRAPGLEGKTLVKYVEKISGWAA